MKRKPKGDIEIFSLSAIDLFAAAMAAFALLTVILLPYYQKEIRERTPDNAISDLLRAAETSAVETAEQKEALEQKRSAAAQNVSAIKSEEEALLAKYRAAEAALLEKQAEAQRAVVVPEPIEDKPTPIPIPKQEAIIEFRFLGMKTLKREIIVALDMNRCMAGHEESVQRTMTRIINSLAKQALASDHWVPANRRRTASARDGRASGGPRRVSMAAAQMPMPFGLARDLTRQLWRLRIDARCI